MRALITRIRMPKPVKTVEVVQRLPDEYLLLVGEIITLWAYQEHMLRSLTYLMLGVGPKRGRIAVRSPRAADLVTMIGDLLLVDGVKLSVVDLKEFANQLAFIERTRDMLAHNIWTKSDSGRLRIRKTSGKVLSKPGETKIPLRIEPAAVSVTLKNLQGVVSAIQTTIENTHCLLRDIEAQLATLPEDHRERIDPVRLRSEKN